MTGRCRARQSAQGTSGVVQAVQGGEGTIAYADHSQAGSLGVAKIKVGDEFVEPTAEGAAKVVEESPKKEGLPEHDLAIDLKRDTTTAGAYPVVLVSYIIVCSKYGDAAQGELVKAYVTYIASADGQEVAAKEAGSAPISDALRTEVEAVDQRHRVVEHGPAQVRWAVATTRPPTGSRSRPTPVHGDRTVTTTDEPKAANRRRPKQRPPQRPGDRIFSASAKYAGVLILVVLAAVADLPAGRRAGRRSRRPARSSPTPSTGSTANRSSATSARWCSAPSSPRSSRWSSRPRSPSGSRCSSRTTRRGGSRPRSATSSTCSPPSPASSTACGARSG